MWLNDTGSITQPPDDIDEVDVVDDEYDEVAHIIESYDEEKEPRDPKSEQVQDMLGLLIDDTAAYLEEQDRKSYSHDPKNDIDSEDPTGGISGSYIIAFVIVCAKTSTERMSNLHLGGGTTPHSTIKGGNRIPGVEKIMSSAEGQCCISAALPNCRN